MKKSLSEIYSGGKEIKGQWEQYKGNILVCDIPEAKNGKWKFRQLFLNGNRMTRSRIPDLDEYYRIAKTDRRMGRNELPFIEGDVKKWNNLIYNVYSYMYDEMKGLYNDQGVPGWGIYLGCETRYSKVENNVVYNINEGMHILHGARHNLIENNVFVNCLKRQIRYESSTPMPGNRFFRNILYNTKPYSEIFNCGREHDHPVESDYNVFYYTSGKNPIIGDLARVVSNTYGAWLDRGYETNSLVADPLFADPANHDYSLLPGSPALKLGFKPIDLSTVGLDGRKVGP